MTTTTTTTTTTTPSSSSTAGGPWMKSDWTRPTAKNAPAYTACVTNAVASHGVKFTQTPAGAGYRIVLGGRSPDAVIDVAGADKGSSVTYAASRGGDYDDQVAAGCL